MSNKLNVAVCLNREYPLSSDKMKDFWEEVGLDLSFNSNERWPESQAIEYMTNMVRGMAPSKIIVANVAECLALCDEGSLDYIYFKSWHDAGFKYIAIDGNNRTITINKYLQGKVSIKKQEYNLPNGAVNIDDKNNRYNTHPKKLKDHINDNVNVTICEYVVRSRKELSELFIGVNNGIALNDQELRNAILVPFSADIRMLAETYINSVKTIYKNGATRRKFDEQLVMLSVYYTYGAEPGISKKHKNKAYEDNSTVWQNFSQKDGAKKLIEESLKIIGDYADAGFKDVSTLLNFFMLMKMIKDEKRKILDKKEFFKWFMRTENRRIGDQSILLKKKKGEHRNYSSCCDTTSGPELLERYKYIFKDLASIDVGIVTELDPERLFSDTQRVQMWQRQNGKCPQTGKTIPEEEIQNHELWEADHVKPYSKGGTTTLDNGELVCRDYNQSKGAKMPELLAA
jgi:hypothetical protein